MISDGEIVSGNETIRYFLKALSHLTVDKLLKYINNLFEYSMISYRNIKKTGISPRHRWLTEPKGTNPLGCQQGEVAYAGCL